MILDQFLERPFNQDLCDGGPERNQDLTGLCIAVTHFM